MSRRQGPSFVLAGAVLFAASWGVVCLTARPAAAVPLFARKYETTCARCHVSPPVLNNYGRAFKLRGYQLPEDEQTGRLETGDPMLQLMEHPPLAFRMLGRVTGNGGRPTSALNHELYLYTAGTIARDRGFYIELESEESGQVFTTQIADAKLYLTSLVGNQPLALNLQFGAASWFDLLGEEEGRRFSEIRRQINNVRVGKNRQRLRDRLIGITVYGGFGTGLDEAVLAARQTVPDGPEPPAADAGADFALPEERFELHPFDVRKGFYYQVGVGVPSDPAGNRIHGHVKLLFAHPSGWWVSPFLYQGKSEYKLSDGTPFVDDIERTGVEFGTQLGSQILIGGVPQRRLYLIGAYVDGEDDNPDGTGAVVKHNGAYLEAAYWLSDGNLLNARWDRVRSVDLPSADGEWFVVSFSHLLRRNMRLGFEFSQDISGGSNDRWALFYDFAW